MTDLKILHCFADHGTEAEALGRYGDVIRVGIEPRDTNTSTPIKADAHALPFEDETFDLGLFHPPCTRWSDMPDANKAGDAPNLIPLAREIAAEHCDEWIIENKPQAPLEEPTILTGKMFGLGPTDPRTTRSTTSERMRNGIAKRTTTSPPMLMVAPTRVTIIRRIADCRVSAENVTDHPR